MDLEAKTVRQNAQWFKRMEVGAFTRARSDKGHIELFNKGLGVTPLSELPQTVLDQ